MRVVHLGIHVCLYVCPDDENANATMYVQSYKARQQENTCIESPGKDTRGTLLGSMACDAKRGALPGILSVGRRAMEIQWNIRIPRK